MPFRTRPLFVLMFGSPSFFLFGIFAVAVVFFCFFLFSLSLSLSGAGEMQTLQRFVFPLVFLPRGHKRAPLPVPRRRLLHQGIAPAPVFFCPWGFWLCFFKRDRSGLTGHHTLPPCTCFLVCSCFLLLLRRFVATARFGRASLLFLRFLGVRFLALRVSWILSEHRGA